MRVHLYTIAVHIDDMIKNMCPCLLLAAFGQAYFIIAMCLYEYCIITDKCVSLFVPLKYHCSYDDLNILLGRCICVFSYYANN